MPGNRDQKTLTSELSTTSLQSAASLPSVQSEGNLASATLAPQQDEEDDFDEAITSSSEIIPSYNDKIIITDREIAYLMSQDQNFINNGAGASSSTDKDIIEHEHKIRMSAIKELVDHKYELTDVQVNKRLGLIKTALPIPYDPEGHPMAAGIPTVAEYIDFLVKESYNINKISQLKSSPELSLELNQMNSLNAKLLNLAFEKLSKYKLTDAEVKEYLDIIANDDLSKNSKLSNKEIVEKITEKQKELVKEIARANLQNRCQVIIRIAANYDEHSQYITYFREKGFLDGELLDSLRDNGRPLLHVAAAKLNYNSIFALLNTRAKPNLYVESDPEKKNALHIFIESLQEVKSINSNENRFIGYLVEKFKNCNAKLSLISREALNHCIPEIKARVEAAFPLPTIETGSAAVSDNANITTNQTSPAHAEIHTTTPASIGANLVESSIENNTAILAFDPSPATAPIAKQATILAPQVNAPIETAPARRSVWDIICCR